jgi:hypothetical protein
MAAQGTTTTSAACEGVVNALPCSWTQEIRAPDEQSPEMTGDSDERRRPEQRGPVSP